MNKPGREGIMAKNFRELEEKLFAKLTPEQRAESDRRVAQMVARVRLQQMRKARELSQVAIAEKLGTDQGSISRMEQQADMLLSTLRNYVEGAGGKLELRAVFPDQTMTLEVN
jgi:DNA-binding transcriptional regulator YiaG